VRPKASGAGLVCRTEKLLDYDTLTVFGCFVLPCFVSWFCLIVGMCKTCRRNDL